MRWLRKLFNRSSYKYFIILHTTDNTQLPIYETNNKKKAIKVISDMLDIVYGMKEEWLTLGTVTIKREDFKRIILVSND